MPQVLKPEVRARILEAAGAAFHERGFAAASVADIARRAGLSAAGIYRYFPDKAALFEAVLTDDLVAEHDRLLDERIAALRRPVRTDGEADALLDFWLAHRTQVATLLDHEGGTARGSYRQAFVDRLTASVAATLDGPLDPVHHQLLDLVFDNTRRALATILRSTDDPQQLRALVTAFWSYQLPGLDGLAAELRGAGGAMPGGPLDPVDRVRAARVGRLATVRADGSPRVVPCWFALDGDVFYTAVDDLKPKSTLALGRLDDVRATERVSLLVDHDDDDWQRLWWVRLDGRARILDPSLDADERARAVDLLAAQHPPYRDRPPPGAVVAVQIERWTSWP